jgi:type VI protein secretion system component VasK
MTGAVVAVEERGCGREGDASSIRGVVFTSTIPDPRFSTARAGRLFSWDWLRAAIRTKTPKRRRSSRVLSRSYGGVIFHRRHVARIVDAGDVRRRVARISG